MADEQTAPDTVDSLMSLPDAAASHDNHSAWVERFHGVITKSAPGAPAPAGTPTAAETAKAATRQTAQQRLDGLIKPGKDGVAPWFDNRKNPAERAEINRQVTELYRELHDSGPIANQDGLPPLHELRQAT